jgi:hypothetical protein
VRHVLKSSDKGVVFHSLRKNFATELETRSVQENIAQQLLGHRKESMTYNLYSGGAPLSVLTDAVELVVPRDVESRKHCFDLLRGCGELLRECGEHYSQNDPSHADGFKVRVTDPEILDGAS